DRLIEFNQVSTVDIQHMSISAEENSGTSCGPTFQCGLFPKKCGSSNLPSKGSNIPADKMDGNHVDMTCSMSDLKQIFSEESQSKINNIQAGEYPGIYNKDEENKTGIALSYNDHSEVVVTQPTHRAISKWTHNQMEAEATQFTQSNDLINESLSAKTDRNVLDLLNQVKCSEHESKSSINIKENVLDIKDRNRYSSGGNEKPRQNTNKSVLNLEIYENSLHSHSPKEQNTSSNTSDDVISNAGGGRYSPANNFSQGTSRRTRIKSLANSKPCSNKRSSKTLSKSCYIETQTLFTPEDLSNELLYPNLSDFDSEVYQNKHAREADFVLHKPKRQPRKYPLPSSFTQSNGHALQKCDIDGLIEPLATEDDLALKEGTKLLMENVSVFGTNVNGHCADKAMPYEAINFALECEIDNFEREEYVQFKRANHSGAVEFPAPYFLLSLTPDMVCRDLFQNMGDTRSKNICKDNIIEYAQKGTGTTSFCNKESNNREFSGSNIKPSSGKLMNSYKTEKENQTKDFLGEFNLGCTPNTSSEYSPLLLSQDCYNFLLCDSSTHSNIFHKTTYTSVSGKNRCAKHSEFQHASSSEGETKVECSRSMLHTSCHHVTSASENKIYHETSHCSCNNEDTRNKYLDTILKPCSPETIRHRRHSKCNRNVQYQQILSQEWASSESDENVSAQAQEDSKELKPMTSLVQNEKHCIKMQNIFDQNTCGSESNHPKVNSYTLYDCNHAEKSNVPYEPLEDATSSSVTPTAPSSSLVHLSDCQGATR
ncbi:hypothetical protein SK128_028549, partial [Halocaridina rubra]